MHDQKFMNRHTSTTEAHVKEIAQSTTAGVWRIKRAKLILGAWSMESVDKLVQRVRVPPQTVMRCLDEFGGKGISYFDSPDRRPTSREMRVEKVLDFLNQEQDPHQEGWLSLSVHYIGRDFNAYEIKQLRTFIASNPRLTQAEIAKEICQMFGLHQSNGKIKKSTAYHILKRMDMDNIIRLPSPKAQTKHRSARFNKANSNHIQVQTEVTLSKSDIPKLTFVAVDNPKDSALWREMMDRFHYINGTRLFGHQIRYLICGGKESNQADARKGYLLGALAFSASTWKLISRDKFIGWNDLQRERNLQLIVNNSRFLILPWINSKCLASRILGAIARQLPNDWNNKYHFRPVLLETFVQLDRHRGVSYQAANWLHVGNTRGYSLYSSRKRNAPERAVYVYPLHKRYKHLLLQQPANHQSGIGE